MHPGDFFTALSGYDQKPDNWTKASMTFRCRVPNMAEFAILEPALSWLDRRRRFHALHRTAIDISATYGPAKQAAHNGKDISPVCHLLGRHLIENRYDVDLRNRGQRLHSECRLEVEANGSLHEATPSLAFAGASEEVSVIREGEVDSFPAALLFRINRINALRNNHQQPLSFQACSSRCPGRSM